MKQNKDEFSEIFDSICTTQDAREVLEDMTALSESIFKKDAQGVEQKIETMLPFILADAMKQYCKEKQISLQNTTAFVDFIEKLAKALRDLPVMTFYMAFSPNEQYVKQLSALACRYGNQRVLLDIIVDKKLIGGAMIAWKGVYKDYSLRKRVDEQYKETKGLGL